MDEQTANWDPLIAGPRSPHALRAVMQRVAQGLSHITGRRISSDIPRVRTAPVTRLATRVGDLATEVVGIYLQVEGELRGGAILILPLDSALSLVDLMLNAPPGKTTGVGFEEHSALAEAGNLTVSYFLNALVVLAGISKRLQPSTPAVIVGELDTILNSIVTQVAAGNDEPLIIETVFKDLRGTLQVHFWVFPDTS